jgi:dynein heavy chain, axonemal
LSDQFKFSQSGIYRSIEAGSYEDYVNYISKLPQNPEPEAFGLHGNAEITTNQTETRTILEDVLSIQPRASSGSGKSREQLISELAKSIEGKTPPPFDIDDVSEKYKTDYNESMNTVLTQEVIRYNKLLVVMAAMLRDVQKALVGEVVMSEELDAMANSLFNNSVPGAWNKVGFLSLKPLASWILDLLKRVKFLSDWIEGGSPASYWVSGFFFPQAFFTGTKQNYARKHKIAIDELSFDFKILDDMPYD